LIIYNQDTDAVLAIFIPPVLTNIAAMGNTIRDASPLFWQNGKPLLTCFLVERGFKAELGSSGKFVPCYPFPEEAITYLTLPGH